MPFSSNSDLPPAVTNSLPSAAQSVFRNVVNSQLGRGLSESRSFASAWSALRTQGWRPGPDGGKWRKVAKMEDFSCPFQVAKINEDQQLVFGWASVIEEKGEPVFDLQGHMITPEDMEQAVYGFNLEYRVGAEIHKVRQVARPIESMFFSKEKQEMLGIDLGKVGWWLGFKVDDGEAWGRVKSGDYEMFSIGGSGTLEDL